MRARDILKDRVTLVLEMQRYRKALHRIITMNANAALWDNDNERDPPDLSDAASVAEDALQKVRK